ncbi:MAG: 50S ribosomal protein L24 [Planctomycetaceae bacterium]|jgi:large subunit ribosomal protein L24|nr:50S ribosomal protein L24 [Planctomycetaceae bacterium]
MRINKNDVVVVLCGRSRGKRTKVISVNRKTGKVTLEGVNVVKRHVRKSKHNPRGGRLSIEKPISGSNVQIICPKCDRPTRVGVRFDEAGTKFRVCKKCNADISRISPQKTIKAKTTAAPKSTN